MGVLVLRRKLPFRLAIPYWIFINGQFVGLMRSREVHIQLPLASYSIGVKIIFQFFKWRFDIGGTTQVTIDESAPKILNISDRERWWNFLFNIDILLLIIFFFVSLPSPWNVVYHLLSDGFFVVWMIRTWIKRHRYFSLSEEEVSPKKSRMKWKSEIM